MIPCIPLIDDQKIEGVVFRLSNEKLQTVERSKDIAMEQWPKEYMQQDE